MIRINLLPVREARRQAGLRQQGVMLAGAVGLGLLVALWIQFSLSSSQGDERKNIQVARAELKELEATRKEVDRFRAEREEIERKLKVIEDLDKNRTGPVRVMDEIATRMPKRLWLTSLNMKQGAMQMKGVSLDAEIVAAFLTSLAESPLIHSVELDSTRLEERDGLKLNTFEVSSRYAHHAVSTEATKGKAGKRRKRAKK